MDVWRMQQVPPHPGDLPVPNNPQIPPIIDPMPDPDGDPTRPPPPIEDPDVDPSPAPETPPMIAQQEPRLCGGVCG